MRTNRCEMKCSLTLRNRFCCTREIGDRNEANGDDDDNLQEENHKI